MPAASGLAAPDRSCAPRAPLQQEVFCKLGLSRAGENTLYTPSLSAHFSLEMST